MIPLSSSGAAALGLGLALAGLPSPRSLPASMWQRALEPSEEKREQAAAAFARGEEAYAAGDYAAAASAKAGFFPAPDPQ